MSSSLYERAKRVLHALFPWRNSTAGRPIQAPKIASRRQLIVWSRIFRVARWAEDHPKIAVFIPVAVIFGIMLAWLLWWPTSAIAAIVLFAAIIAVIGLVLGWASRALRWLKDQHELHQRLLSSCPEQQLQAVPVPDDQDGQNGSTESSSPE
jgi:hypothetical protein